MKEADKKHIITIAGRPGSGKSTASKSVASTLGYQHFSSGDRFRELFQELDLNVLDGNKHAEKDERIDLILDEELRQMGATVDQYVIDSRMAWHWIPASFKVYLDLDLDSAATRIIAKKKDEASRHHTEYVPDDPKEYAQHLQERLESEMGRYKKLYDANPYDTHNYDLVVDTKSNNPEQVATIILNAYRQWLES